MPCCSFSTSAGCHYFHYELKPLFQPIWKRGVFLFRKSFKIRYAPDYTLLAVILLLLVVGAVMVYSSSYVWAEYKYADQFFYLKRQLLSCGVGLRSEEHTSELQSRFDLVCRLLLEKKMAIRLGEV